MGGRADTIAVGGRSGFNFSLLQGRGCRTTTGENQKIIEAVHYGRTLQEAWHEIQDNNIANARNLLASTNPEFRNLGWDHLHELCDQLSLMLKGHTDGVYSVAWSPDSSQVVTGSADNTAKVWDAKTGKMVMNLNSHADDVRSVAWSPDGSRIVTGSDDNTARVWYVKSALDAN